MGVSNVVDDASGWNTTDTIQVSLERAGGYGEGAYWVSLSNPYHSSSDSHLISPGVTYYFTLSRLAGSDIAILGVFSDAARTTLVDTLTISGLGTKTWRYFYAAATYNDGTADYYATGFYQNFLFLTGAGGGAQIIGLGVW